MARFDFIESSASGYRFLMHHHSIVGRIALVPLLIKVASFVLIAALDMNEAYLRQGLFLIPSYFAEGWLVAQLIRLALFKETWPAMLSGDRKKDMNLLHMRFRSIMSATIIYVLIKLVLSFASGLIMQGNAVYQTAETPEPSSGAFFIAILVIAVTVWAFRFLWLYIPAAMGYSLKGFVKVIAPYQMSIYMIATWLLCFIPLAIIFVMVSEVFVSAFPSPEAAQASEAYKYAMVGVQAVLELLITIVSSVAMAYGIYGLYHGGQKKS